MIKCVGEKSYYRNIIDITCSTKYDNIKHEASNLVLSVVPGKVEMFSFGGGG